MGFWKPDSKLLDILNKLGNQKPYSVYLGTKPYPTQDIPEGFTVWPQFEAFSVIQDEEDIIKNSPYSYWSAGVHYKQKTEDGILETRVTSGGTGNASQYGYIEIILNSITLHLLTYTGTSKKYLREWVRDRVLPQVLVDLEKRKSEAAQKEAIRKKYSP